MFLMYARVFPYGDIVSIPRKEEREREGDSTVSPLIFASVGAAVDVL